MNTKTNDELVAEIHDAFYSSEDRLLKEAKQLLANPEGDKAKRAERAKKLGFGASKPVKEDLKRTEAFYSAKGIIQKIEYYRIHYPNNKFITEAEVKRICEKYGLLLGDAGNYLGDIPEKNLAEIEAFELRKEDWVEKKNAYADMQSLYFSKDPSKTKTQSQARHPAPEKERPDFKICAPQTDFNTAGYVVREGYILIYDPVVLQPVKDGFLIVTAWGKEASDELVINEAQN